MNTELPPSIIVDDHGTIRDAMLVDFRAGMATYKISSAPLTSTGKVEELRKALADCVECLKRLPDVEGAHRVTCLSQAQQALGTAYSGEPPEPTRLETDTNRALALIGKALGS